MNSERQRSLEFTRADILALVDFCDQITKIYHQGARAAQHTLQQPCGRHHTLQQPCGRHHTFEHRDEMRRDRIWGRSKNTLLNSERRRSPKFTRVGNYVKMTKNQKTLLGKLCPVGVVPHPRSSESHHMAMHSSGCGSGLVLLLPVFPMSASKQYCTAQIWRAKRRSKIVRVSVQGMQRTALPAISTAWRSEFMLRYPPPKTTSSVQHAVAV